MRRAMAWVLLLAGCGGAGDSNQESAENILPTTNIEVVLQMDTPPAGLREALSAFAENNGVDLVVSSEAAARPSLVELDVEQFSEWLHADRLAPLPAELADLAADCWGADAGRWEGESYGLPWRVRPVALLLPGGGDAPADWPELQALQAERGPWVSDAASLVPSLLSLSLSAPGDSSASEAPLVDGARWTEALSFYTRSLAEDQLCEAEELERRVVAGAAGVAPVDPESWKRLRALQPDRAWTLAPYPPLDAGTGSPRVDLGARFLVLPRSGAHRDLAVSLARQLHARAGELLAGVDAGFLPASRTAELEWEDWDRWSDLLPHGFALPPFARRASFDQSLRHAVEQSIGRKRNPAQALSDARRQFEGG